MPFQMKAKTFLKILSNPILTFKFYIEMKYLLFKDKLTRIDIFQFQFFNKKKYIFCLNDQEMFNSIQSYYNNDDISERKEEYYNQVLIRRERKISPDKPSEIKQIPQPGKNFQNNALSYPSIGNSFVNKKMQSRIEANQLNIKTSQLKKPSYSQVNSSLLITDPQRYKVLQQRAQLFKKLQIVTLGLSLEENSSETELTSNNYIMPHYKSDKIHQVRSQQKKIKELTAQIFQNQKSIGRISQKKNQLLDRINRIRAIDKEIYEKLDQDRSQEIQGYLRTAKNLLALGQSEDKILSVLKKCLY